jgi:NAD(P)-dependent dehydrogenase (short-subunit alcohol dehydrogenase family)
MPGPYDATYAASKAFLQSFAQAVRFELKDTGVTVTALQPGPTDTDFFERAGMEDTKVAEASKDDPAEVARDDFEALMAGKDHVIGGSGKNRAQVADGVHPGTLDLADRPGDRVGVAGVGGVAGQVHHQQVGWDSTMSTATTVPAASPTAVVIRPMPSGSAPRCTRMVIE